MAHKTIKVVPEYAENSAHEFAKLVRTRSKQKSRKNGKIAW